MELMDNLGLDGLDIDWVRYNSGESKDSCQEIKATAKLMRMLASCCHE
jgi:GH18 family chitinase